MELSMDVTKLAGMNRVDMAKTKLQVESFNKSLAEGGRRVTGEMGRDDFLRLLVVQLEHQDPTNPLDDKQFIAQMAQFSALEQMTQMNTSMQGMMSAHRESLSSSLLGRMVEVFDPETGTNSSGVVSEIDFSGSEPSISFNGMTYSVEDISRVSLAGAAARPAEE